MKSFLLFSIEDLHYALDLDYVNRIVNLGDVTPSNSKSKVIDGIINYEDKVVEVASFRKMISKESYIDKIHNMFDDLKAQHKAWLDSLSDCVHNDVAFSKTTNPHMCNLGKWIDSFSSYDNEVSKVLVELDKHHKNLHKSAITVLDKKKIDKNSAIEWCENSVKEIYTNTISYLDKMQILSDQVANESQKILMLGEGDEIFALKVDEIEDIVHIDENIIKRDKSLEFNGRYLEIDGVFEVKDKLRTVVEKIKIKA